VLQSLNLRELYQSIPEQGVRGFPADPSFCRTRVAGSIVSSGKILELGETSPLIASNCQRS
jgi:hypothetical protein